MISDVIDYCWYKKLFYFIGVLDNGSFIQQTLLRVHCTLDLLQLLRTGVSKVNIHLPSVSSIVEEMNYQQNIEGIT